MAVDERARHELHAKLDEILGSDEATTLMSYLPPVGWADVATKRDLDALEVRLDGFEGRLDAKVERLRADVFRELNQQTRVLVFSILASNATLAGLTFFAAARLS